MPAYNAEKYIHEAIRSVLNQSFTDFELLIVNDGSTDQTPAIIASFQDNRIKVIHQENQGVALALNKGLQHACAAYIARFDADDICYPDRLQIQYDFIRSNPDYSIIGSAVDYIDESRNHIFTYQPAAYSDEEIRALHIHICPFIHSSVMYKKEAIIEMGGYNEYAYTFEDHLLWANMLKREKACNLHHVLIQVRLNPASITIDEKWRPVLFRKIKYDALRKLTITKEEGQALAAIGKEQNHRSIKQGSYYALLAKKYLWNNHHPKKARENLIKTLKINPFNANSYLLFLLSFLPKKILRRCYHTVKTGALSAQGNLSDHAVIHRKNIYAN